MKDNRKKGTMSGKQKHTGSYSSDTIKMTVPRSFESEYRAPEPAHQEKRRQTAKPQKPEKKQKHPLTRFLKFLVVTAVLIFGLYSLCAMYMIERIQKVPTQQRTVQNGSLQASYVKSILLIGTDARDSSQERGRSDSMILLSFNSSTQKVYVTSFMRDCYVEIPGYGCDRLNAAYSLGGAELLLDTLEYNFDVRIDDYVTISFPAFASIIDAFGGITLEVSDDEADAINEILISEVNELMGDGREDDLLTGGGTLHLSGKQALSYARIRYVGNADFERTSRQRIVMEKLFQKARTNAPAAVPGLVSDALPKLVTNMNSAKLYGFSLSAPFMMQYDMVPQQIPAEGTWWNDWVDDQSVLQIDNAENTAFLRSSVYAAEPSGSQEDAQDAEYDEYNEYDEYDAYDDGEEYYPE